MVKIQSKNKNLYIENIENKKISELTKKNIEDIQMLKSKFDRGEITYDAIDQLKMKSFDQSFKNPKTTFFVC